MQIFSKLDLLLLTQHGFLFERVSDDLKLWVCKVLFPLKVTDYLVWSPFPLRLSYKTSNIDLLIHT